MKLEPCVSLHFNGNCEDALAFYERHLGAKVSFKLTWGDSPMANEAPPGWSKKVLHASFMVGDTQFAGGDVVPTAYQVPRGFSITLSLDDLQYAERLFEVLAENGTVTLPIQQTFWAKLFGSVTDPFGISWEINCE